MRRVMRSYKENNTPSQISRYLTEILSQAGMLDLKSGAETAQPTLHLVDKPSAFPLSSAAMIAFSSCLSSYVNANPLITISTRFTNRSTMT